MYAASVAPKKNDSSGSTQTHLSPTTKHPPAFEPLAQLNNTESASRLKSANSYNFGTWTSFDSSYSSAPIQMQALPDSDYDREIVRGGRPAYTPVEAATYAIDGANDAAMDPKRNTLSDGFNSLVTGAMDWLGYDTRRRAPTEDNDFYRDYAQYMPGYNIDGIPSGAWAQNAATNHVGHGTSPGNTWDNVRRSLVDQERNMIESDLAAGGTGQLSYWDLYDAHVDAYDNSGGGGNSFIDPGSFALAVYGAPLLESFGIDSGPITGASIDIFNNPEDSATEGWAKRMGLAGGEIAGGLGMTGAGLADIVTGSPIRGSAMALGGLATTGLGAFGGVWNTATAIDNGMLSEWGDAIGDGVDTVGDWIFGDDDNE